MDKRKLKEFEARLQQKSVELTKGFARSKSATHEDAGGGGAEDFVDYAVNAYTKEFLLSLTDLDRQVLTQVEDAMARIRTEEYGVCIECDKPIGVKRLEAVPWTPCCISCQENRESEDRLTAHATARFAAD